MSKNRGKQKLSARIGAALGSAIDETICAVAPVAGNRRLAAKRGRQFAEARHQLRMERLSSRYDDDDDWPTSGGGFISADTSRPNYSWLTSRLSPDAALELDHAEMVRRSNSAYKNYELASSHVERRVNRVAGPGIMVAPQIRAVDSAITEVQAAAWNPTIREAFERWAQQAGGYGVPLYMIQRMVARHLEKDGEAFVQFGDREAATGRMPVTLKVRVIHPNRVETPPDEAMNPKVRQGKVFDDDDELIGFYVRVAHPGDNKDFRTTHDYIPARFENGLPRMVHVWEEREANLSRGYPQLQVSLKRYKNTEEYEEADLERNIIAACYGGFIKGNPPDELAAAAAAETNSRGQLVQELSSGRMQYVGETDEIVFSNPPGPQNAFAPYIDHQNRMTAAGVVSSYEMMSGDWRGLTYSQGKLIWNDELLPIDCQQMHLIELFLIPLYQNFVNRCVTQGVVDVSQAEYRSQPWLYEQAKFIPPKRYSLDPARERRAAHADIAAGIIVHSDEVEQMNGRPAEDVYDDIERNYRERRDREGVPLEMPQMGGAPTQAGDDNPAAEEGSDGAEKRQEVPA